MLYTVQIRRVGTTSSMQFYKSVDYHRNYRKALKHLKDVLKHFSGLETIETKVWGGYLLYRSGDYFGRVRISPLH